MRYSITFQVIYFGILLNLIVIRFVQSADQHEKMVLNVAIIGAGASGLASAKYTLAQGYNVTVYEQTEQLGGIWWYTDQTGKDQYGNKIFSPMYQNLR